MTASPAASLRASALALLADGNRPESVAQVLGVTIEQLVRWQQGHGDDGVDRELHDAAAPAYVRPPVFDSEVSCGMSFASRVLSLLAGGVVATTVASLWYFDRHSIGGHIDTLPMVLLSLAMLGMISPLVLGARARLVFGPDALTQQGALFKSTLRYADITSVTIAAGTRYVGRGAREKGYQLTFLSGVHVAEPMSWFIFESHPLDAAVVERLRRLPGLGERDVAPLTRLSVKPRRPFGRMPRRLTGDELFRRCLYRGTNVIGEPGGVMFRRALARQVGPYDATFPYVVDLDYWLRLLEHGDGYYLPETLVSFRVSPGAWSVAIGASQATQFAGLVTAAAKNGRWRASAVDLAAARGIALGNNAVRLALYRLLFRGNRA